MKTHRKIAHLLVGSAVAAVTILGGAGSASAEICTVDAVPAATLTATTCETERVEAATLLQPAFHVDPVVSPDDGASSNTTSYSFYSRFTNATD